MCKFRMNNPEIQAALCTRDRPKKNKNKIEHNKRNLK